jgi:hypothetical protein
LPAGIYPKCIENEGVCSLFLYRLRDIDSKDLHGKRPAGLSITMNVQHGGYVWKTTGMICPEGLF